MVLSSLAMAAAIESCSWDKPGVNPYHGDLVKAVDAYQFIPLVKREALKAKIGRNKYDYIVTINRNEIKADDGTQFADLRYMHFGKGQICNTVTRDKWAAGDYQRAMVFCEGDLCVIRPEVCNNISLVTRKSSPPEPIPPLAQVPPIAVPPVPDVPYAPPTETPPESEPPWFFGGPPYGPPIFFAPPGGPGFPPGPGLPPTFVPPGIPPSIPPTGSPPPDFPPPIVPPVEPPPTYTPPDSPPTHVPPTPVPEPGTWAMMISGLIFLGWMHFRKRRKITKYSSSLTRTPDA